ncbi:MAG: hypothetical protein VR69_15995 [Peptococcaceae bacterium BRH_c4b]|nr:MAG: hypothetical protein VR69_15995 [Peptococcaceae bacterium BRH_c4b]
MKDDAEELGLALKDKYGAAIEVAFVDVATEELKNYPKVAEILQRVRLPLTVINGEPRFHGGLSSEMISDVVDGLKNA